MFTKFFLTFRQGVPFKSFTSIFSGRQILNLFDEVQNAIRKKRLMYITILGNLVKYKQAIPYMSKLSHFKESRSKFTFFIFPNRCRDFARSPFYLVFPLFVAQSFNAFNSSLQSFLTKKTITLSELGKKLLNCIFHVHQGYFDITRNTSFFMETNINDNNLFVNHRYNEKII